MVCVCGVCVCVGVCGCVRVRGVCVGVCVCVWCTREGKRERTEKDQQEGIKGASPLLPPAVCLRGRESGGGGGVRRAHDNNRCRFMETSMLGQDVR